MILSVSRRTDIPGFYPEWFINRLREEYVMARNPMNYHQISKILLTPKLVDCIVFWTKNPRPLFLYLDEIREKYHFYFQYTLNAYGRDIEANLPPLEDRIKTLQELSKKIGKEKIIWRYDPILLSAKYSIKWHIEKFDMLAKDLSPYVETCVFSFLDMYAKIKKNLAAAKARECTIDEMNQLAVAFSIIGKKHKLCLRTCAEAIDLDKYGILHNKCIDPDLICKITGYKIDVNKDKNQRQECGCVESIDIGQYNTCSHGCKYCYANFNLQSVLTFKSQHRDDSPLLIGSLSDMDKVTERKVKSLKSVRRESEQVSLFS